MAKNKKFKVLDPMLHSQLRLAIVSFLMSNGTSDFNEIKEVTKATSGNISVQLKKLQKVNYLTIEKGFLNNYQHTTVTITKTGIEAFENYVEALKAYIE
ncbi:MAG: transcriptional regulator [Bacteroidota bacterium]